MANYKLLKEKIIAVKVDEEFLKELDIYADKLNLNRSQLMRNLMKSGMEDLKVLHHTGALALISSGIDILKVVRNSIKNKRYKIENNKIIVGLE